MVPSVPSKLTEALPSSSRTSIPDPPAAAIPGFNLDQEIDRLVLEQIKMFKYSPKMNDAQILEYHLRHCEIMRLYMEKDLILEPNTRREQVRSACVEP